GDLRAAHPLAPHREVEHAAARAVGELERPQLLVFELVQPHLQHAGLERDLQAAAGEDQPAPPGRRAVGHAASSTIASANRSVSAAIVRLGFGPTGPGITEPSATWSRG